MRNLAMMGVSLVLLLGGFFSLFNVPDGSQAQVFRGSEVHRTVGPGLQARIPLIERVEVKSLAKAQ
ncbi:MAG: hypothetical protein AAGI06_09750 [Pseudomonadota bacterium]